jgi:hypothetical protein
MSSPGKATRSPTISPIRVILFAGFVAGLLDGADAVVVIPWIKSIPAIRILHFIASGLIGIRAFRGGWRTAILGVAIHFFIATSAAAIYYLLTFRLSLPVAQRLILGPAFGICLFAVMQNIIVPLSAAPRQPTLALPELLNLLLSHSLFVGLPIALITGSRSARAKRVT